MTELLKTITELSHEFGTDLYVKGGGGNTSCKTADTLWVKPSGTTLVGLKPETFVEMDRAKLKQLFTLAIPADKTAREALVKDTMAAAVKAGQTGRPSVEAPLHDVLGGTYVVHTHPALVNGMTCSKQGAGVCGRLFPDALWVPYTDPGYTLCVDVNRRIQERRAQRGELNLLILENHGIFVSGNSAAEVRAIYQRVMTALRSQYEATGVKMDLRMGAPAAADVVQSVTERLQNWLGSEAAAVVSSAPFAAAEGPICPDHIVYSKSYAYRGELSKEGLTSFRARHGYAPRVVVTPSAVFGVGGSLKQAQLALELAQDGALVAQLAAAYGGLQCLSDAARAFIENWEVESYRSKLMA